MFKTLQLLEIRQDLLQHAVRQPRRSRRIRRDRSELERLEPRSFDKWSLREWLEEGPKRGGGEGEARRDELLETPFRGGVEGRGDHVEGFDEGVGDVEVREGEGTEGE